MLELYIRDGKPTRMLESARRQIEAWQAEQFKPVDISDWPDDAIANLDMAVRERLATNAKTCGDPFYVAAGEYSCITAERHQCVLRMLFDRAKADLMPVNINGKSYSISAARDLLDARENARAS